TLPPSMAELFGNFQYEIYIAGLSGQRPAFPIAYRDLEAVAKEKLRPEAFDYVAGGAGSEDTVRENSEACRRWRIVPRMLKDGAGRSSAGRACNAPRSGATTRSSSRSTPRSWRGGPVISRLRASRSC